MGSKVAATGQEQLSNLAAVVLTEVAEHEVGAVVASTREEVTLLFGVNCADVGFAPARSYPPHP